MIISISTDPTSTVACIILAGGQSQQMASRGQHKVCSPVAGRPAIVRAIDTYKMAGLRRFLVVVGQMAEQVITTVSAAHPEVTFVFQSQPLGTGHAATIAVDALSRQGYQGPVMVVMGDKFTRPPIIRRLLNEYFENQPDVLVSTLPKEKRSTAGRLVNDGKGKILASIELPDLQRARRRRKILRFNTTRLTAEQVEKRCTSVNASMYCFQLEALQEGLKQITQDNPQCQFYLSDTVEVLARDKCRSVRALKINDPADLMGFNTPAELMALDQSVRQRQQPSRISATAQRRLMPGALKPAQTWMNILQSNAPKLQATLARIYGTDDAHLQDRRRLMIRLLKAFARRHGWHRNVIFCRAPGRVNLMGRHIDHRGGFVNVMAISREVMLVASDRPDDRVTLENLEPGKFPPREFHIYDLLRDASWSDWTDFLASRAVQDVIESARGDWSHYARAPLLRLQHEARHVRLKGMDCVVYGDIPTGAGLSSSSAMVVAFAEAAVALNRLRLNIRDFIDLCGEGEWFVGSRGGSADHAAIRTSRVGYLSRIGFFPFRRCGEIAMPEDLRVVIAHSGEKAVKSAEGRDIFNQRIACYQLAEMLLRRRWAPAAAMSHLRDISPRRLKINPSEIYRGLLQLPIRPRRSQVRNIVPTSDHDRLDEIFSTHTDQGGYNLRGVTLFGISECLRSERFAAAFRRQDLGSIAQSMRRSHDGDRRVRFDSSEHQHRFTSHTNDRTLQKSIAANTPLVEQCGSYACSTESIDQLVDVATATHGVVGAQLAGAGLGGCMMILLRDNAIPTLMKNLRNHFYQPHNLSFNAHTCLPVEGAGLIRA